MSSAPVGALSRSCRADDNLPDSGCASPFQTRRLGCWAAKKQGGDSRIAAASSKLAPAREQLGRKIDHARRKIGMTIEGLAGRAGYDERTIRNVMAGRPTRVVTLLNICNAVGIAVDEEEERSIEISREEYGGYTKEQYQDYLGFYYAYRRSFSFPRMLLRTIFKIEWDKEAHCLAFAETHKYESPAIGRTMDFSQKGHVYISPTVNLLHLLTHTRGALRLITLTKLRLDDLTMQGIVLTQARRTFYFQPSVSPIFFQQTDRSCRIEELATHVGPIRPGEADYEQVFEFLAEVERNIGIFAMGPNQDAPRLTVTQTGGP
jgi:hypothetical protein